MDVDCCRVGFGTKFQSQEKKWEKNVVPRRPNLCFVLYVDQEKSEHTLIFSSIFLAQWPSQTLAQYYEQQDFQSCNLKADTLHTSKYRSL